MGRWLGLKIGGADGVLYNVIGGLLVGVHGVGARAGYGIVRFILEVLDSWKPRNLHSPSHLVPSDNHLVRPRAFKHPSTHTATAPAP